MAQLVTISQQNHFDVTIQAYGGLDDLSEVLRELPDTFDINSAIPFNTAINLVDTQDSLARRFRASGVKIATTEEEVPYIAGLILQEQGDFILQELIDNISQQ